MTSNEILRADLLDILFDNRNKQYGAYILRRQYNQRLLQSLAFALGIAFLFFWFLGYHKGNKGNDSKSSFVSDSVMVKQIEAPKTPPPPIQPVAPKPHPISRPVAQLQLVDLIKITPDNQSRNLVPDLSAFDHADVSNVTVQGQPSTGTEPGLPSAGTGITQTIQQPNEGPVTGTVEKEPEFPGGVSAWLNYLSRNLRTPDELNEGEKRTVLIRFEVSKEGTVEGFQVLQSGGVRFDNEVIRVLKKMPKWKPAMQNGHSVARYFTQPVSFMAAGE
jgi:protein TonB